MLADNVKILPHHPAYDNKALAGHQVQEYVKGPNVKGDVEKAIGQVLRLSRLEDPPLRLMLGKEAFPVIRDKLKGFSGELDRYESWSSDLDVEE